MWIAVGGTPQSIARAGTLGLPLALAIIGGTPERFAPLVDLYREAGRLGGHDASKLQVSINSHGYLADDPRRAADEFYPPYADTMTRIGRERGWPPTTRQQFEAQIGPEGALLVGSPEQVIEKILFEHEVFRHDRFLMQLSVGTMPHERIMHAIELFGTKVAPEVRRETARRSSGRATADTPSRASAVETSRT